MKKIRKGKINIIILVIFFLALLSLSVYAYVDSRKTDSVISDEKSGSSITDNTAGWKTYKNEKYGFEFKYPAELADPKESIAATKAFIEFGQDLTVVADTYYNQQLGRTQTFSEVAQGKGLEDIQVDGKKALGHSGVVYISQSDKNFLVFENQTLTPEVFRKIIATVKFTDLSPVDDMSTWKTYKNTEYGFEFNYPPYTVVREDATHDSFSKTSFLVYKVNGFHQLMFVYNKSKDISLNSWYEQTFKKQNGSALDESFEKINEYDVLKISYDVMGFYRTYYFIDGGPAIIGLISDSDNLPTQLDLDQTKLLNSIKFTNSSSTDPKISACIEDYKKRYPHPEQYGQGEVVVGFSDSISLAQAEQIIKSYNLSSISQSGGKNYTDISGKSIYEHVVENVKVATGDEFLWSCRLKQDSGVRYAEPSPIATVAS